MRAILISFCFLYCVSVALAQAWDAREARRHPGPFLEGMAVGVLAHEAGHALVATSKGFSVGVQGLSVVYPDAQMSPADHYQVASAGIQTQWLLSECLLRAHEAHPETAMSQFRAGVVMSHVAISAAYLVVLKNQPTSDTVGMANATGASRDTLAAVLILPAALDYWRLTGKHVPHWVPAVSAAYKGAGVAAVWTY